MPRSARSQRGSTTPINSDRVWRNRIDQEEVTAIKDLPVPIGGNNSARPVSASHAARPPSARPLSASRPPSASGTNPIIPPSASVACGASIPPSTAGSRRSNDAQSQRIGSAQSQRSGVAQSERSGISQSHATERSGSRCSEVGSVLGDGQQARLEMLEKRFGTGKRSNGSRISTAGSGSRPGTGYTDSASIPSCAVRSSCISMELEIEREKRINAEKELARLKEQLGKLVNGTEKEKECATKQK